MDFLDRAEQSSLFSKALCQLRQQYLSTQPATQSPQLEGADDVTEQRVDRDKVDWANTRARAQLAWEGGEELTQGQGVFGTEVKGFDEATNWTPWLRHWASQSTSVRYEHDEWDEERKKRVEGMRSSMEEHMNKRAASQNSNFE